MRLGLNAFLLAGLTTAPSFVTAFTASQRPTIRHSSSAAGKLHLSKDLHSFDYLLQEGESSSSPSSSVVQSHSNSRRSYVISPGGDDRRALLASAVALPNAEAQAEQQQQLTSEQELMSSSSEEGATSTTAKEESQHYDPYGDALDSQMNKINQYQEVKETNTFESRFKKMDLQDIIVTIFIPAVLTFAGGRWVFNRVSERVLENTDVTLDSFASEMVYHDGDFEEMKMCYTDYKRRLMFLGPKKSEAMIKRYLQAYAKKKTVSPQAISSLSYVFTLFKLSEAKAAQMLVTLCKQMGGEKISSAGKLLFFGSRILKSDEGKAALLPIKEMIMGTYREQAVAETLVETSQQAIGEAAYRTSVLEGGKNQKTLTIGWEVLGLTKEDATRIFKDEAEEGFLTDREAMYGNQSAKYDKKGRKIDDDGELLNPDEAEDDDDDDDDDGEAASNVYSCSDCGYTLFIAQGREFKFYGDDFKCPECGAPKDKFNPGLQED